MGVVSRFLERFRRADPEEVVKYLQPLMGGGARPLPQPTNFRQLLKMGYEENVIAYACIRELATSASEPELKAFRGRGLRARELSGNHPLSVLLAQPNPQQDDSQFTEELVTHLETTGNAFVHKRRSEAGLPVALYSLRPDRITKIHPHPRTGLPVAYDYTISGTEPISIPADNMIHLRKPSPLDDYWGLSPLFAAAAILDLDNQSIKFLRDFFANAGVPLGLLFTEQKLTRSQKTEILKWWEETYGAGKRHKLGVFGSGTKYQEVGSAPDKLRLEHIFGQTEARICSIWQVPPILIAAKIGLDRSSYANYRTARISFWQETMVPLLRTVGAGLTSGLAHEFGSRNLQVRYDLDTVQALQDARLLNQAGVRALFDASIISRDQARAMLKMAPAGGPDVFKVPLNSMMVDAQGVPVMDALPASIEPSEDELSVTLRDDMLSVSLREA